MLQPSLAVLGWVFPVLAVVGLVWAIATRRTQVTITFLLAIVVQTITLWFMSKSIGAETPYMAYKMGYLAIYPLAIFGALALHAVVSRSALPVQTAVGCTSRCWATRAVPNEPPRSIASTRTRRSANGWPRADAATPSPTSACYPMKFAGTCSS